MHRLQYQQCFRMEGEFREGLQAILERVGLTGPAIDRALATEKNVSPRQQPPVYTPDVAERVHRLYSKDFELFGYPEDAWNGL
jgi:hypothetical protein